ncbi:hypothetical protein L6164_003683 [Bauhinia variegata]|uniref:Uncharacterized protein n=1 Tax=Bauhinia variegata TaxID=167791 RepID=A0ACB9Q251_BAUVA|nr:hypothetical protein L6164_003683 [Bauhinia variegata]
MGSIVAGTYLGNGVSLFFSCVVGADTCSKVPLDLNAAYFKLYRLNDKLVCKEMNLIIYFGFLNLSTSTFGQSKDYIFFLQNSPLGVTNMISCGLFSSSQHKEAFN